MKPLLQSTAAECGLACLAMVADHHGLRMDMADLRRRFTLSLKGATLQQLMRYAQALNFSARPLRLDLHELKDLRMPCCLHWDLNHFVVLTKVSGNGDAAKMEILDPAMGKRVLSVKEASNHFTGVALELTPNADFKPADHKRRVRLRDLTGRIFGLRRTLTAIFILALALEAIALLVPMTTQWVVDDAVVTGDKHLLLLIVLGAAVLALTDFSLRMARGWISMRLSMDVGLQWTSNVFHHLSRLPVSYFEQRHLGDITSRFGSLSAIKAVLTEGAIAAALDGIMLIATFVLMWLYSPALTGIALAALGVYALLRVVSYRPFRDANEERIVLAAKENSYFLETIRAITPLKLFGREAERLADIVLEKPEAQAPVQTDVQRLVPSIELRNVSFRYGEGEPWVLKDLSLMVQAGENVAIVGPSGCGKTTLLKVMLGLHLPQEGEVLIGGVPIRQLGLAQYRQLVGTVMQDDALLAGSIAENISFFDTQPDQQRIEAAAAIACVHADIAAMPMGYQTLVGDMGTSLSGGQKQRVLLARALYKLPRILALDEATSHLDIENERKVNQAVRNLRLTRITIAHRPETIANAGRVIQLHAGKVARDVRQAGMEQDTPSLHDAAQPEVAANSTLLLV
jgi:ATP-binding cassette subfamily B protein RaxB